MQAAKQNHGLSGGSCCRSVIAATDAGREGELIFRFVYQMAGCTKTVKRLWISSMEDAAIREGFANLRPDSDYDALYQSVQDRKYPYSTFLSD